MNMNTINGRTPEEIKLRLACIFAQDSGWCEDQESCEKCEYNVSGIYTEEEAARDSLILIQQLERERDAAVDETESLRAEIDAINEDYLRGIHTVREDAQPKWISVEERLPDDLEEVLILVKETELYGQYNEFSRSYFCQYIGSLDDGEWYTVWCNGYRYIKDTAKEPNADKLEVTHWMPLPEPPKEE